MGWGGAVPKYLHSHHNHCSELLDPLVLFSMILLQGKLFHFWITNLHFLHTHSFIQPGPSYTHVTDPAASPNGHLWCPMTGSLLTPNPTFCFYLPDPTRKRCFIRGSQGEKLIASHISIWRVTHSPGQGKRWWTQPLITACKLDLGIKWKLHDFPKTVEEREGRVGVWWFE